MNLHFRPRPIDVFKKIPVVHGDLDENGEVMAFAPSRMIPVLPTGMEPEDEQESHIQRAMNQAATLSKLVGFEIPTPGVRHVKDPYPSGVAGLVLPANYVRTKGPGMHVSTEGARRTPSYDLDDDDFVFLENMRVVLPAAERSVLTEDKLEAIIETWEREAALQRRIPPLRELERKSFGLKSNVLAVVYEYWTGRRSNHKSPLLEILRPSPDPNDMDPLVAFRARQESVTVSAQKQPLILKKVFEAPEASGSELVTLADGLKKIRQILELVRHRERKKHALVKLRRALFQAEISGMTQALERSTRMPMIVRRPAPANLEEQVATRAAVVFNPANLAMSDSSSTYSSASSVSSSDSETEDESSHLGSAMKFPGFDSPQQPDPPSDSVGKPNCEFPPAGEFEHILPRDFKQSMRLGHAKVMEVRMPPRIARGGRIVIDRHVAVVAETRASQFSRIPGRRFRR